MLLALVIVGVLVVVAIAPKGGSTNSPAAAAGTPHVILDLQGTGIQRTAQFTTTEDWRIDYAYDCSNTGLFQIMVQGDTFDLAANVANKKGSGSQPEYTHGTFYLEVNSSCPWHVVVNG